MRERGPPWVWTFVLRVLLPRSYRDVVLDDVREAWSARMRENRATAARWYRREVARSIFPALRLRIRRGAMIAAEQSPRRRSRVERTVFELRLAGRRLARSPGFTVAAALTIGVGVAGAVAMFSLIDGVLLRDLPYRDSERLIAIRHYVPGLGLPASGSAMSEATYLHYREHGRAFEDIALWQEAIVNLAGDGEPERVDLALVTPSFFPMLGVSPMLGPGFGPDAEGGSAVMLSHGIWQRRYGGDATLVGKTIDVNGVPRLVAGVLPPTFRFPNPDIQLWMDLGFKPGEATFGSFFYGGAARLRAGVTLEQARADLARMVPTMVGEYSGATAEAVVGLTPTVVGLKEHLVGDVSSTLWLLFGMVGFVLLIACANVTNLHLVRATAREREVVVRSALGAARGDLLRHYLMESVVLSAVGGVGGLGLGWLAVRVLVLKSPVDLPRLHEVSVDARIIAFGLIISLVIGVGVGIVPAIRIMRLGIADVLRAAGRALTSSRERQRTQRALVAVQVALALTLLVGSALMGQTLWRLLRVDPGFDPNDLLTFEVVLPFRGYEEYSKSAALQLALLDRVRALPGVLSAGAVAGLPMASTEDALFPYAVEAFGRHETDAVYERRVLIKSVTRGYFETMRTRIAAGRDIGANDRAADGAPVIISTSLAARLFPGESPVGKRLRLARRNQRAHEGGWNTVIGVAADVRDRGLAEPPPEILYVPILDAPVVPGFTAGYLTFALRTQVPPTALVPAVREALNELDPLLPIANVRTMRDIVNKAVARPMFVTLLLVVAASAALFLGMIGIYGVLSYAVGQRRRELGLRMALGARAEDVLRLVLRDGLVLTITGLVAGGAVAGALTRFMRGLLFEVSPTDPVTFLAAFVMLVMVAVAACLLPARRAAAIQPIEALADE